MNKEACHQAAYREFILSASFIRADWHSQYPLLMMEMPICMHTHGERYRGRKAEGTGGGEDRKEGKLKEKIGKSSQFMSILSVQPLIR